MSTPKVYFDEGASPLARIFARTLSLAVQKPAGLSIAGKLSSHISLKSCKGAQSITINFSTNSIRISDGIAKDAALIIEMDFEDPAGKPKIRGLLRHPIMAYRVGALLSMPLPNWADSAKRFWASTSSLPNMPGQLTITCTNEARSLTFGEGTASFEVLATSAQLESLLTGQTILVMEAMNGRMRIRGSLEHLAGLSQACQKIMLGEIDG